MAIDPVERFKCFVGKPGNAQEFCVGLRIGQPAQYHSVIEDNCAQCQIILLSWYQFRVAGQATSASRCDLAEICEMRSRRIGVKEAGADAKRRFPLREIAHPFRFFLKAWSRDPDYNFVIPESSVYRRPSPAFPCIFRYNSRCKSFPVSTPELQGTWEFFASLGADSLRGPCPPSPAGRSLFR